MIKNLHKVAIIAGEREVSFSEMLGRINLFAQHTPKGRGEKTVILSENREGWIYAFFSIWQNQGIAVPVDASSTVSDVAYILRDCTPSCIWTSREKADTARKAVQETGAEIRIEIIDDYELAPTKEEEQWCGIDNMSEMGDECAMIIYTSGTTGSPKGVMLSYNNLMANIRSVAEVVPIFNENRRVMILLPLHHVLPLMGTLIGPMVCGGGVAICPSMSGPDIMDTLCRGKVAIFIGVPRLWQTLYAGIKKKIDANAVTKALFNICRTVGSRRLSHLVFKSIHKKMGGHIDFLVSGGAALDAEIGRGLRTLGLDVLEGYGMTETAPIISFTRPNDIIPGCVGLPMPAVECKIVDGELCAKGPNVMIGYYNRPEETAAVIDKDGFLHTGDLARFDEKGRIFITGRSKEIIVLSNGKNVQPCEIEYKIEKYADKVKEAAVIQHEDMLRCIIVPQEEWARSLSDKEVEEALKREVIEPYNRTVSNYKKLMSIFVYRGELPRTKLDKLQRFKLKELCEGNNNTGRGEQTEQEADVLTEEFTILKRYIEGEKKIQVKPTHHLETDLAFDSLDMVGLEGFIEQTFGITINADAMSSFRNVQELADRIAASHTRKEVEQIDGHHLLKENTAHLELPVTGRSHRMCIQAFKAFFKVYNRLDIRGTENIPLNGQFIMAANHQSYMDGAIVMAGVPWNISDKCYFYATEDHVNNATLRKMAGRHNIIIMERRNLKNSILKLAEVLKLGKNIVIFPEGTRSRNGGMGNFKKTFAILSKELGVPVLPVCIKGAYDALPRGTHFYKPKKITLEYLPLMTPSENEDYELFAERVKATIEERVG